MILTDFLIVLAIGMVLGFVLTFWFKSFLDMFDFVSPCCRKPFKTRYSYTRQKMVNVCSYCNKEMI